MLNIFSVATCLGQDVVYSQFYANPLYLNPSLAGSTISKRLSANYRNQWPSLNNAFTSYSVSYDQYIDGISGGIGVLASRNSDVGGLLTTNTAHLMYAFRLQASNKTNINMGLAAGLYQRRIDWESLDFADTDYDPQADYKYNSRLVPDFSFGAVLGHKDVFYVGTALHHLSQPVISFSDLDLDKLHLKYTIHTGGNIFLSNAYYLDEPPKVTLSPALVYIYQNKFQQINLGMNITVYPFVFGIWYRNALKNSDAIIALVGFQLRGFQFGYSYDATISKFSNATGGAHEISLGFRFAPSPLSKRTLEKQKEIPCPRF